MNSCLARFRRARLSLFALPLSAGIALLGGSLQAKAPVPPNLAGNLDVLVQSRLDLKAAQQVQAGGRGRSAITAQPFTAANGKQYASQLAVDVSNDSITNPDGRVLVMVHPRGQVPFETLRATLAAKIPSLTITAVDTRYKAGVLEGWVDVDDVAALAQTWGVGSVMLEAKPEHNRVAEPLTQRGGQPNVAVGQALTLLGTAFDQGVTQHRVDTFNKFYNPNAANDYEGQGMQIACISDSYAATTAVTSAATDVTNFDLPGASNNPAGNNTPVFVYGDYSSGTDEGRAMCQIVYKMAPKAAVAFGTADTGEVGFANTIRGLGGLTGYTLPNQTFAADVICDDVGYQDEPFFQDGIIGQAVDDVSAAGVAYFSSAGNDVGTYDYDSDFRYVPNGTGLTAAAGNAALANTNINLANVPTNLYQGGFHNFGTATAQDVAITYNVVAGTALPVTNFQWNDPFNQTVVTTGLLSSLPGNIAASSGASQTFTTPSLTAGQYYAIEELADAGSNFDGIVTVTDPNGNAVVTAQDTGTDETIAFYPGVTGAYTVTVSAFGTTGGPYHVNTYTAAPNPQISTDFNLLVFDTAGNYLPNSSLVTNNIASNVPYEAKRTSPATGQTQVQYLVSRSAIPTAPKPADHFRILIRGNGASGIGPAEYITINTPNTKGHAMATTCNGTAAYSVFRPSLPEYYTSPGPATVYYDKQGNRLATPDVRLQPRIGAADNASNSFFASDSTADADTKPNFSGTSAAAPHAAACALLALQAHGGRRSVTPAQMTSLLQRSTFPHDLDPNSATGVARSSNGGKVTITVGADLGLNPSSGAFNPNSINVSYVGPSSIATLVFNPAGTAATGGGTTNGNNGLDNSNVYFDNVYPGIVFEPLTVAFTPGNSTFTLPATAATFSNQAPLPSTAGQWWTMTVTFPANAFTGGNVARFTVGHGPQHNSTVGNGAAFNPGANGGTTSTSFTQADLFGGTVRIPQGDGNGTGMTFSGTTADGGTFTGTINNRIGAGWSQTDGYGFINAQTAISQTVQ